MSVSPRQLVIGGACVFALVGAGAWIGRSSSSQQPSPSATPTTPATDRRDPVPRAPAAPSPSRSARRAPALAHTSDPGLAQDLTAADPKIRRAAAAELARSDSPDPALVIAASKDADLEVAVVATRALGTLYADGRVPLAELVARSRDRGASERVRQAALGAFGAVPDPEAAKILVDLLAHGDAGERRTAAAMLGNQDPEVAVPALIAALADLDEFVRENALAMLRARSRGRDFGTDANAWATWWRSRSSR